MLRAGLWALLEAVSGEAELASDLRTRKCLIDDDGAWLSYQDVVSLARAQVEVLRPQRGGVALIAPENDVASVVALLSAWGAGLAVALLNGGTDDESRAVIARSFQAEVTHAPRTGFVATGRSGERVRLGTGILLSTSGTTGSSKFVRLSTNALLANADQIAVALGIVEQDVAICHLPLHYSYGLSVVLSHLERGASAFLTTVKLTSPEFFAKIEHVAGTHLPGVPFHYETLARLGLDRLVPASVKTFTQAGGHLERRFRETIHGQVTHRGGAFYVMYGQTEAGPRMTTLPSESLPLKPESVGRALRGGRFEIVDAGGDVLPPESVGQVVYHGPNVMWGYATSRACLNGEDQMNGRLETGDIGRLDADGDLFIVGRNQRFAKVAGLRIGLDEVERRLKPDFDVALISGPESIQLYFTGPEDTRAPLSKRVSQIASEFKIPTRSFVLLSVPAIPHQASGKVDYARLSERL